MKSQKLPFPQGFLWGAATAAHQVEGGNIHSDWWAWEQKGGGAETSGIACDHYRRFEEDFRLAQKLHHNAHRFSIEWARIEPEEGKWNQEAIQHYQEVLKNLQSKEIKAFVTLYHFTLPLWFAQKGGFEKKENIKYFERYVKKMVESLGDLADFWLTINEPTVYIAQAYLTGLWPPQKRNPLLCLAVFLNLAEAHKRAYRVIHQVRTGAPVGMAANVSAIHQYGFLGPLLAKPIKFVINDLFYFLTRGNHDFLGINYYFYHQISLRDLRFFQKLNVKTLEETILHQRSDLGWPIYPPGIYEVVVDLKKYHLPIYITENGVADAEDKHRERFIVNHLTWLHQAIKEGADVRGYLHWTLMDNFEWALGFKPKFGLVEVDFVTQKRKIRPSALAHARICKENALEIGT